MACATQSMSCKPLRPWNFPSKPMQGAALAQPLALWLRCCWETTGPLLLSHQRSILPAYELPAYECITARSPPCVLDEEGWLNAPCNCHALRQATRRVTQLYDH